MHRHVDRLTDRNAAGEEAENFEVRSRRSEIKSSAYDCETIAIAHYHPDEYYSFEANVWGSKKTHVNEKDEL